jgi:hypothetical protein
MSVTDNSKFPSADEARKATIEKDRNSAGAVLF